MTDVNSSSAAGDPAETAGAMVPGPAGAPLGVHSLGGSGAPLLMVHATGLHGRVWAPVASGLHEWDCRAVDLRGHGASPLPDGDDLSWEGFGADVGCVADLLGDGVVGVGHSLGAVAMLIAAADRPSRFSAIVLYEPALRADGGPVDDSMRVVQDEMVSRTRRRRATFGSRAEAMWTYSGKPPFHTLAAESLRAYVEHGFSDTDDGRIALRCTPDVEARAFARTHDHDLHSRLDRITCPVTVVRGGATTPEQVHSSDALARRFGAAAARVLDDADHFGPLGQPRRFARVVRESLDAGRTRL